LLTSTGHCGSNHRQGRLINEAVVVTKRSDNTFVVIQPDADDPAWFASVAVLDESGYEIVRRDITRRLAAREFPGQPTRQISDA
jgi:hypothetical protein